MAAPFATGSQSAFLRLSLPNIEEVVKQLGGITERLIWNMRAAMTESNAQLLLELVKNLNQQVYDRPRDKKRGRQLTGTLRRSWAPKPVADMIGPDGVAGFTGGVGSRLVYAPIIEFGYDGPVRAHIRMQKRLRGRKRQEAIAAFGGSWVRAHHRIQRPRPYALPALAGAKPKIEQAHTNAANAALEGKPY